MTSIHPITNDPIRLGKRAPRIDPRTLKMAKYITALPSPPPSVSFWAKVHGWPMYLNDQLGDCVIAASGHAIQQWTAYASSEEAISDSAILKGYEAVGGYVPGNPDTDNGCDMLTACKYWRSTGFGGHKIVAFVKVDQTNPDEIRQAIALFGNCYFGLALPVSAQKQTGDVWAVPPTGPILDGSPGSWGGHCVLGIQYDKPVVHVVTWGAIQMMTWNFIAAYCDEAYALLTHEWIEKRGLSPSGFGFSMLKDDLGRL